MRALAVVVLLAIAAPAAACPMRLQTKQPVDPVVALQHGLGVEGADVAGIAKNARSLARQRSRPAEQRARALAVVAAANAKLGNTRVSELATRRAEKVDGSVVVAMGSGN